LIDEHRLEPALQGGILLDVFAVLIDRRGADAVQFAPRQHRLEQVSGVHRPFRGAGPDDGVQLVDEQNDLPVGALHLFQDGLQPLLEFPAVLRPRDQRSHVEGDDPLVLQALGHVSARDPLSQPLDNGRLADARLSDQDGVVLGAPGENLDDAPDLVVAADDGIEFPPTCELGEVPAVFLEGLVGGFWRRARDALASPDGCRRSLELFVSQARVSQKVGGGPVVGGIREGHQHMLDADVLVFQAARLSFRCLHRRLEPGSDVNLSWLRARARDSRQPC